jgi:hypothetical protein
LLSLAAGTSQASRMSSSSCSFAPWRELGKVCTGMGHVSGTAELHQAAQSR